jgi:hypothetical protein
MRRVYLCIVVLTLPAANAADFWLFLKDGRVCLADSLTATSAVLIDGKSIALTADQIRGHRTRAEVDQAVDAMLAEIVQCKNMQEHADRFTVLKQSAVPRLLQQLQQRPGVQRLPVIFALQYAWAPDALEPVLKLMNDPDGDIVYGALSVLINHLPMVKLREQLLFAANHKSAKVAGLAFQFAEHVDPDLTFKRIHRIIDDPTQRKWTLPVLAHYFMPELTPATVIMLKSGTPLEKRQAVNALIEQLADDKDTRAAIADLLAAKEADLRESAAEYYTWLGRGEDLSSLSDTLKRESDAYTRAALSGAIKTIGLRDAARAKLKTGPGSVNATAKDDATFQKFLDALHQSPTTADWSAAREFLSKADSFEPFMPTSMPLPDDPKSRFRLRSRLEQRLFAAPCGVVDEEYESKFLAAKECPPVTQLVPPLRDYFDPKRKSFGHYMDPAMEQFADSYHVGDDCGWQSEFRTVVAIAPGVVRLVDHIPSWGHIVIVEHTMDGKPFCSLYAHLSPMLHVRPGEIVEAGQKLGAVGRSLTVDNGGYHSHLHFGIHRGAYSSETRWVCGYVSPQAFTSGNHGWVDPQAFLKGQ